uniref:hypothetical protein n=1 Tax=Geofilum rhodophaeum TaxID=1965019 RepID=UPI00197ABA48
VKLKKHNFITDTGIIRKKKIATFKAQIAIAALKERESLAELAIIPLCAMPFTYQTFVFAMATLPMDFI